MQSEVLGWCAFCAVILGAIVSVLRPDNTVLPFSIPAQGRIGVAVIGGAIQSALMNIVGGTPWQQAVGAALVSVIAALGAHGFRDPAASAPMAKSAMRGFTTVGAMLRAALTAQIVVFGWCVLAANGCTWAKGSGPVAAVDAGACIAKDAIAGKSVSDIAKDCGADVASVLSSLLASQEPKVQGSPAFAEARAARRAMGLDGGA